MNHPFPWLATPSMTLAAFVVVSLSCPAPTHATDARDAKKIFLQRCTACHSYGRGVKVGPDLKGVTERRARPWLLRFVRSSQTVIKAGDPVAVELFQQFKQQRMPDWTDLNEGQITAILDWLAANGPEQKEPDERHAELASAGEIDRARALFHGRAPLASGGLACATCHSIRDNGERAGGTLAPELTKAYDKYQDRAMTLFFKRPCSPRTPELTAAAYLTPHESFALKAYLRIATLGDRRPSAGAAPMTGAVAPTTRSVPVAGPAPVPPPAAAPASAGVP